MQGPSCAPQDQGDERQRLAQRLSALIREHRSTIETRWLERVRADICYTPGVEVTALRNAMANYLGAVEDVLNRTDPRSWDQPARAAWAKIAQDYGVTRVLSSFDVGQLIHEFIVLRHVIHEIALAEGVIVDSPDTPVSELLDAAIEVAIRAYMDARDYELRRKQAEHVAFLTHELRNPLTAAMLIGTSLGEQAPAALQDRIAILNRSLRRLTHLIDSVLLSEKLAANAKGWPIDVQLRDVVEGAIDNARGNARRKGLEFRVTYDPDLAVRVDPNLTRSAIQKIVENAVKYTERGSVDLTIEDRDPLIEIHVRDTCDGLSAEELHTIFAPFDRGTLRKLKSGTGLGLTVARNAIEVQGGSIHAESLETAGCHFWIVLPKRVEAQSTIAAPREPLPASGAPEPSPEGVH